MAKQVDRVDSPPRHSRKASAISRDAKRRVTRAASDCGYGRRLIRMALLGARKKLIRRSLARRSLRCVAIRQVFWKFSADSTRIKAHLLKLYYAYGMRNEISQFSSDAVRDSFRPVARFAKEKDGERIE